MSGTLNYCYLPICVQSTYQSANLMTNMSAISIITAILLPGTEVSGKASRQELPNVVMDLNYFLAGTV